MSVCQNTHDPGSALRCRHGNLSSVGEHPLFRTWSVGTDRDCSSHSRAESVQQSLPRLRMSAFVARSAWLAMLTEWRNRSAKTLPEDCARNTLSGSNGSRNSAHGRICHIIRKRDLFLGVDISAETTLLITGRATVTASGPFIGLENESMIVHSVNYEILWCSFCSLPDETAGTAEPARA